MPGLIRYLPEECKLVDWRARPALDRLAQFYIVEFETPWFGCPEWFLQIRFPDQPVTAGYYAETLEEAARLIIRSLVESRAA
ncbi:MAG: hypothetical protein KDA88_07985 [Planctomycetaceae bacterium]|nr:hypothetical protein [Planctomycetaceae bacterium]MCB9953627.1 hypothetical protein [Planctomycetaceae bacterium]